MSIDFLPCSLRLRIGTATDYRVLERFHYLPKRPATWATIVTAVCVDRVWGTERVVAVAVLSHPSILHRTRHQVFDLKQMSYGNRLAWVNANLRTISRVIVHPQFRSIGLARVLIQNLIDLCPTRYIEASARMGRAHPIFERAGMIRVEPLTIDEPVYYWIDRIPIPVTPES